MTSTASLNVTSRVWRGLSKHLRHRFCHTKTSSKPLIVTSQLGPVATVGINRPEKRNCVNRATALELISALRRFDEDDSVVAMVLHGVGGNFCAGYDLEELSQVGQTPIDQLLSNENGPMGPSRMLTKKPLIAAVSGYAVAGGLELALLCDLRVMEETAIMGVFCRRFGVPLIDGGTVRLPAAIGFSRAMDMILTGRPVKGKEAFEWGLANRIVACGTALGQAVNLADSLKKFPQQCLRADRRSAYYATYSAKNYEDALQYEAENGKAILALESVHGATKFMEGVGHSGSFHLERLKES